MDACPPLPLVDISRLASGRPGDRLAVARDLDRACRDAGFLYVTGAQLDRALFSRLEARAKSYFAMSHAEKMQRYIGLSVNHSGYVPEGEEQFGEGAHDRKESYDIGCEYELAQGRRPLLGPNLWPEMSGFRDDVLGYYRHVTGIGRQIFACFALALGLPEDHFEALLIHPPSQLRLIHYPFNPDAEDRPGIGDHTDYECFTLLFVTAPGLQVVDRHGYWADVPLVEGALIMNIGDMMEVLSNGRYLATRHRVRKVREERYAFPLFHACDYDQVIAPVIPNEVPHYQPIRSGEHLFSQTARTFRYLKQRSARGAHAVNDGIAPARFGRQARGAGA